MATSNLTNDPKTATADEAAIQDLPESKDSRALTPDEETNVRGGVTAAAGSSGGKSTPAPSLQWGVGRGISTPTG